MKKRFTLLFASLLAFVGVVKAETLVNTGVYTISADENKQRGELVAAADYADYPVLDGIDLGGYTQNSVAAVENGQYWYVVTKDNGATYYFYNIVKGKFLVAENGVVNFGDTPCAWTIAANGNKPAYLNVHSAIVGKYLSAGCGRTAANRPIAFDTNGNDGGALFTFTELENGTTTFANQVAVAYAAIPSAEDAMKADAKAALNVWTSLKVFESVDFSEAVDAIDEVAATGEEAQAAINEIVLEALAAIEGKAIAFHCLDEADAKRVKVWVSANSDATKAIGVEHDQLDENGYWALDFVSASTFYIKNATSGKYLGNPGANCPLTEEATKVYSIEVIDAANSVVEFKCGGETLHASNHDDDKLLNWDDNEDASRWAVVEVGPLMLPVVGAKVGEVAIVEGAATVESISTIDITFDRPVALVKGVWAEILDPWGGATLQAEVLADNNCVVRFTVDEYVKPFEYVLNIPAGLIVDAATGLYANAVIKAVITIEGGSDTPSASLNVVNVTVGEDVMEGFIAVAAPGAAIKVNFDGMFYLQSDPTIVDAKGENALGSFDYMSGIDYDGSYSYVFFGKNVGTYTITLAKAAFMEYLPMYKAPAEDIVLTVQIVAEPEMLPIVSAMVGDVAIVEGAATVESISTIDITFDRPVALVKGVWAEILDPWGGATLQAEVLADNNCVVRFTVDEYFDPFEYVLNIPAGLIVDAATGLYANAVIEAVITIEGGSDTPSTSLNVVNVTVGGDVMEGFSVVAAPETMIKVNFDGKFYFQGEPSIVDAEGEDASSSFDYMNGLDWDGSNSYIFMGKKEGTYTITLAKAKFNENAMMGWKAPAEDIVLTVQILANPDTKIENIATDAEIIIYDLSGRRVEKMTKGLYIVNGKKFLVK